MAYKGTKSVRERITENVDKARRAWLAANAMTPISIAELDRLAESGQIKKETAEARKLMDAVTIAFAALDNALDSYYGTGR